MTKEKKTAAQLGEMLMSEFRKHAVCRGIAEISIFTPGTGPDETWDASISPIDPDPDLSEKPIWDAIAWQIVSDFQHRFDLANA
jgi:hypothetical protein